ncbi:MAG: hypothetical protein H6R18_1936 [Proteobacteria bacterium]|nr:hypothetical protein [Pseudomonadota bacterium]
MTDVTYGPKIYKKAGGDEQVVASGGLQKFESGGVQTLEAGSQQNIRGYKFEAQPAPTVKTVANTLTIAELLTKIINATPTATGATAAYTLPTGALIDAGVTMAVNDSFDWVLINNALAAADTITVTASTGHTIVGNPVVQSLHATTGATMGYSSMWRTRKTAADTFVTYRIA